MFKSPVVSDEDNKQILDDTKLSKKAACSDNQSATSQL